MPQDKKKSIKEFADEIRQNAEVPEGISDEALVRQVFEAVPEAMSQINISERRPYMKPEGSAPWRFAKGMGATFGEAAQGLGNAIMHPPKGEGGGARTGPKPEDGLTPNNSTFAESLAPLVDMDNVGKDKEKGDDAHAMGRSATQGILTAFGLKAALGGRAASGAKAGAALGEMEAIGAETTKDAALAIAKRVSKPQAVALDNAIDGISKAMANQYISSKSLSAGIAYAKKTIEKVSKAPGAQVKDVSAAKEAIMRLDAKIKANPNIIPWNDAREMAKELDKAKTTLGPSAARNSVGEVSDALKAEISTSANKAGQGAAYEKWTKDYASMSKWQRAYAKIINRQTQLQKETQLAAKDGLSIGVPKTNIKLRLGKARTDKIAEAHKKMIDTAHKGLEELDGQIKQPPKTAAPAAGGQPPATPPVAPQPTPQAPPQGGNPSMAQGQAAYKQGQQHGMAQGKMPPVMQKPPIAPSNLGPMQQRILEELKKQGGNGQVAPPPQS